ncbi:MAG: type IV pilus assembly protein PilM, partial [Deltaproteobacteria bacterium]|nr:type IV pilus assembly protein PilM [Deltaproteobacteria bacterium]
MALNLAKTFAVDIGSENIKILKLKSFNSEEIVVENYSVINTPEDSVLSSFMEKPLTDKAAVTAAIKSELLKMKMNCHEAVITVPDLLIVINWLSIPVTAVQEDINSTVKLKLEPMLPQDIEKWFISQQVINDTETSNVICEAMLADNCLAFGGVVQKAGYVPVVIDSTFFNMINVFHDYLTNEENETKNIALVLFGSECSTVSVYKNGEPKTLRNVPIGGSRLTKTLISQLNITKEEAEELKKTGEFFLADNAAEQNKVQNYNVIKPVFGELIKELYNSFDSYLAKFREFKIDEIILSGGGANFKNIEHAIQYHLNIPIKRGDTLVNVKYDDLPMPGNDV